MTVSAQDLSLPVVPLRLRRAERPGVRDWAAALAWMAALIAAHLLLFVAMLMVVALR